MNVKDLDGKITYWHLHGNINKDFHKQSTYHKSAKNLLTKIYPTMQILEEVPINIRKSEYLYLDFYIPLIKTCIEVHGEQHYKFVAHYHSNQLAFLKGKKRDIDKKEWCITNNIDYVELPYYDQDKWEKLIIEH
jgi:hypothetical protein